MKVNSQQKIETRRAILQAAVDIIIDKGFRGASMRAIARRAGVGDATIYNYFPTKEALLYGYYFDTLQQAHARMEQVRDLADYDLREKLQVLFETALDEFLADREFVMETFPSVFFHPIPAGKEARAIRTLFISIADEQLQAAIDSGDIPEVLLRELLCHFIWDFFIATVLYWIKDETEQFANTTIFIDKSLDLGYTMLKSGVLDKATGLLSFLFKSHVLSNIDLIMEERETFRRIQKEFMNHEPH